jgi:hypothetical protein
LARELEDKGYALVEEDAGETCAPAV